ncbi:Topoisomerase 1-associated factor like [Actinidia chinensis var. chinensis]|uniref:Topoisomerase 1-associated factor like n=1 Tax=Actinidia chinensis var. chinensis TaxID=1590841 RepID=A0A2R6R835_ACTCC|nr:Topoisomerase 1-associated factor like [Actinidia chinensis var. chinensis]
MELKINFATIFILISLLIATPCLSTGIYDIDYRGPETHSYLPPPNRSGGKLYIHRERTTTHRKFKGFRDGDGGTGKKIHG